MKISQEEVSKIASLARLEADQDKLKLFANQLNNILEYMDKLNELDTAEVNPLYSPVSHKTAFRQDQVEQDYTREEVLKNNPEGDQQYFIVPKVF